MTNIFSTGELNEIACSESLFVFVPDGAMLTSSPTSRTICEKFFLPNGNTTLDLIYDVTTSVKCTFAMNGNDTYPNGNLG